MHSARTKESTAPSLKAGNAAEHLPLLLLISLRLPHNRRRKAGTNTGFNTAKPNEPGTRSSWENEAQFLFKSAVWNGWCYRGMLCAGWGFHLKYLHQALVHPYWEKPLALLVLMILHRRGHASPVPAGAQHLSSPSVPGS